MYSLNHFLEMASKKFPVLFIQIEDAVVEYFDNVVKKDNLQVNMSTPLEPEFLLEYIEGWRRKIWDQAFGPILKGANVFKKSDSFTNYNGLNLAVRRVLFWYVQTHFLHRIVFIHCSAFEMHSQFQFFSFSFENDENQK